MRTYAADTALPGGKYENGDEGEEGTAVSGFHHLLNLSVLNYAEKRVLRGGQ